MNAIARVESTSKTLRLLRKIRDEIGPSPNGGLERDIAAAEKRLREATAVLEDVTLPSYPRRRFIASGASLAVLAAIVLVSLATDTEARRRPVENAPCVPNDRYDCPGIGGNISVMGTPYQPIYEPLAPRLRQQQKHKPSPVKGTLSAYKSEFKPLRSLAGFPIPLINKISEIKSKCGSRIVSAYRPGARVRGSGTLSNHALKKAVDVAGNPSCIYQCLKKWPGGYSTDYRAVQHVHISYNRGKEWGQRFSHYGSRTRYASRRS